MRTIARRLFFYLVTAAVAISLDFLIPRLIPGNTVDAILSRMQGVTITPAIIRSLDLQFGVGTSASLWDQYTHYWNNVLHGNLGLSSGNGFAPVTDVIRDALPYTLGLVGLAIDLFAITLGWFPTGLAHQSTDFPAFDWTYVSDVLYHAVLPALTIVAASAAGWIVGMRNVMLTTMDEDYVLIAAAKGLPQRRVIWYAARNAILPSVSGFALAIGFIVSGSLLTEIVFSYPGLGSLLLQAVSNNDYALMQGLFLIITFAVLAANLIADFVYVFLDPRTRQEA